MKLSLKIFAGLFFLFLSLSSVYAAGQALVFDPICSYEVGSNENFMLPVGVNFLVPITHIPPTMSVSGLTNLAIDIQTTTPTRLAGVIRKNSASSLPQGVYYLTIAAEDLENNVRAQATMKLVVVSGGAGHNAPIIFDPLSQIANLTTGRWYSLAIGASDADNEPLSIQVTGAAGNGLGYVSFTPNPSGLATPGRTGGALTMYLSRPGEFTITVNTKDGRPPTNNLNSVAELRFSVGGRINPNP